jgi:hypothetical protein
VEKGYKCNKKVVSSNVYTPIVTPKMRVIELLDTTGRIIKELELMIAENSFSPELTDKIIELIKGVNSSEINLFDYRRHNSSDSFDEEVVYAVAWANKRQQVDKNK